MNRHTVWILQTGESLPSDPGSPRPMRAMNLSTALIDAGHRVVLWSADFNHQEKKHRAGRSVAIQVSENLEVRLIHSPGYGKNVGPGRMYDHAVLGWKLSGLLREEPAPPDVAFVGYPPIETAAVMTRWLRRRRVPVLLDVKDHWPPLFMDALPGWLRPMGRVVLSPYYLIARRAMREADGMTAMAEGFLDWGIRFAGRRRSDHDTVVPLTSRPAEVTKPETVAAGAWWDSRGVLDDGTPRVCFVGSHSRAFDFGPVADAAVQMADDHPECEFVICGDGESSPKWREMIGRLPNTQFAGWVDRAQLTVLSSRCIAALAPYRNSTDFRLSVPNKIIDALSLGLPILSPLGGGGRRYHRDS
jgi:glycosyltransferase involved in cell wall biosynthesis